MVVVISSALVALAATPPAPSPPPSARPVVYIQAGHQAPMEPGYRAQTGATGGPFGTEERFNVRVSAAVEADLRSAGVDAIHTPGKVSPYRAPGAAFVSIHFDQAHGAASIGYAVYDPPKNHNYYYHGQGAGSPSSVRYPDSAPQRPATKVTAAVMAQSHALADAMSGRFRVIFAPGNGAHSRFLGVQHGANGNLRMQFYYGYRRTNTAARVIIECGTAGADNRFLAHVDLIAGAIASGIIDYLRATHQLPPPA